LENLQVVPLKDVTITVTIKHWQLLLHSRNSQVVSQDSFQQKVL